MSRLTAAELGNRGCEVSLLTYIDDGKFTHPNVKISTYPSPLKCFWEILRSDYVICEGAILRLCWPLLLLPKKSIVVRHMPMNNRPSFLRRFFERWLSFNAAWAGVSQYVADHEIIKTTVVPNACNPKIFYSQVGARPYDLLFVGSLTTFKGVPVIFDALKLLDERGIHPNRLTLVGEGSLLEEYKKKLDSNGRFHGCEIVFTGNLQSQGVADLMRQSRCLVVPSSARGWKEALSGVCIEGPMCGCYVISSDSGGMSEATGPCGAIAKADDAVSLAEKMEAFLTGKAKVDEAARAAHLAKYTPQALVDAYFSLMTHGKKKECFRCG